MERRYVGDAFKSIAQGLMDKGQFHDSLYVMRFRDADGKFKFRDKYTTVWAVLIYTHLGVRQLIMTPVNDIRPWDDPLVEKIRAAVVSVPPGRIFSEDWLPRLEPVVPTSFDPDGGDIYDYQ